MTSTAQLKSMSMNTLEERLSALSTMLGMLTNDYVHAFDSQENICMIVHEEIDRIVYEIDSRQQ
jgi:hypothetical protein